MHHTISYDMLIYPIVTLAISYDMPIYPIVTPVLTEPTAAAHTRDYKPCVAQEKRCHIGIIGSQISMEQLTKHC